MQKTCQKLAQLKWVLLILLLAPMLIKRNVPDPDTFFLAATGRWIVQNMTVPFVNPFVIHQGFAVIIQQWGFDVLMYILYEHFGSTGLWFYTLIAYGLTVFLMHKFFGLFTQNQMLKAAVTLMAAFRLLSFASPRPTSLTIIIMLAFLYALEKWHQTASWKWLVPLPILSLIQINMHASMWPMLFIWIIPYIFPHIIPNAHEIKNAGKEWVHRNKALFIAMLCMMVTGFINPYGMDGMLYVFRSYGNILPENTSFEIVELAAPTFMDAMGVIVLIAVICITIFVTLNVKKMLQCDAEQHNRMIRLYTAAGTTLLAAMHVRNMWYLLLGVLPLIVMMLDKVKLGFSAKPEFGKKDVWKTIILFVMTVLLSATLCNTIPYALDENVDSEFTPIEAVQYLDTKEDVTLFNEFNSGSFLEWKGYQVYIDARPELFTKDINHKEDILQEYIDVRDGRIDYEQFLDKYNFSHLIVSNPLLQLYLEGHPDYTAVVRSETYILYEYTP